MERTSHDKISIAVDFLLFTVEENQLKALVVRRKEEPFQGLFALPGVAVGENETLAHAAKRCLVEETGITKEIYLEQLYTWGDNCSRDPRGRVISVSYMALIPREQLEAQIGKRVSEVKFISVEDLLKEEYEMAFDHKEIISYGRERLRNKTEYTTIAFHLMPEEFTLPELQKIYEIILGKGLYKANFRKNIKDYVLETGNLKRVGAHRPSMLYKRNQEFFK